MVAGDRSSATKYRGERGRLVHNTSCISWSAVPKPALKPVKVKMDRKRDDGLNQMCGSNSVRDGSCLDLLARS